MNLTSFMAKKGKKSSFLEPSCEEASGRRIRKASKKEENKEASEKKETKEEKIELQEDSFLRKKLGKEEIELEDGSLEGLAEQPEQQTITEANNFSEFMVETNREMPIATLPNSLTPIAPEENLEAIEREPRAAREEIQPERENVSYIRNPPQYTAGTSEETILKGMEERRMMGRTAEELRDTRPRVMIEDWHEVGAGGGRGAGDESRDYIITELETREEEKQPFQQQKKYRTLKR